jgi:hypothetical protein
MTALWFPVHFFHYKRPEIGEFYVLYSTLLHLSCDSFVAEDAGIEPRTIATFALTVRRSGALLLGWLAGWLADLLVGW